MRYRGSKSYKELSKPSEIGDVFGTLKDITPRNDSQVPSLCCGRKHHSTTKKGPGWPCEGCQPDPCAEVFPAKEAQETNSFLSYLTLARDGSWRRTLTLVGEGCEASPWVFVWFT